MSSLPVLDYGLLVSNDPLSRASFIESLRGALADFGFFYISNTGLDRQTFFDAVFAASKGFFALPLDEKMKISNIHSPQFRGYSSIGTERTNNQPDNREQIDFGLETTARPKDPARLYASLHGPNQWPDEAANPSIAGFRATIEMFMAETKRISLNLMRAMALVLGQDELYFEKTLGFGREPHIRMKILRYPDESEVQRIGKEQGFGVGPHKDYGFLAVLIQDAIGGLQVQLADGQWIDATPIPETFIVNVGEMFEAATGGLFKATLHRVLTNTSGHERFSIPYFFNPDLDVVIAPIDVPQHLKDQHAMRATSEKFGRDVLSNAIFSCYGENAFKGLSRSHLDVTAKFYPEAEILKTLSKAPSS